MSPRPLALPRDPHLEDLTQPRLPTDMVAEAVEALTSQEEEMRRIGFVHLMMQVRITKPYGGALPMICLSTTTAAN